MLHYRPWQGRLHGSAATVWPIARVAVLMVMRRKLFWMLYALGLSIFMMFFFGQYLVSWAVSQQAGRTADDPNSLINWFRKALKLDGSAESFRMFFWWQGYMVMIVLAMAGSILVGNDFHFRSLPFYLSKPLSRWQYLLGKCLAVAVFVNLMTTIPALALFIQYGLLDSWDYFYTNGWVLRFGDAFRREIPINSLLFGILGYGLVLTICLSLLLVATATWVRRTVPLIMVWTTLFAFLPFLATALVEGLHYDARWRLINLWNDMYLVGSACLGVSEDALATGLQPRVFEASLVLISVSLLCLSYLNQRIRAVEIVG